MHVSAYGMMTSLMYCCMVFWLLQWLSLKVRWHSEAMDAAVRGGRDRSVFPSKMSWSGSNSPLREEAMQAVICRLSSAPTTATLLLLHFSYVHADEGTSFTPV